ncbi:FAD binding domain-containing protein [Streptomyces cellulosae]
MRVHEPQSVAATLRLLDEAGEESKVIAGGTALMIMMRNGLLLPEQLIALERLSELDYIHADPDGAIRLGALTSLKKMQSSPQLRRSLPTLTATLGLVANHRVRQRATIGGNLSESDYASDPPAVLTTLGCRVHIASTKARRVLSLPEFLVDYYENALEHNELVTEVEIPRPSPTARTTYLKYVSRSAEDRPCVGVAAYVDVDRSGRLTEVRVAVSGATSTPFTMPSVTDDCRGAKPDSALWEQVGDAYGTAIEPIDDVRGSADYRKHLTSVLVHRALASVSSSGENGASRL